MKTLLLTLAFFLLVRMAPGAPLAAHPAILPGAGFPASRYETLWEKSPFCVETSVLTESSSSEYTVVGVAQIGGVDYASLMEKATGNHFIVASDKRAEGLILRGIHRTASPAGASVLLENNGQLSELFVEMAPQSVLGPLVPLSAGMPVPPGGAGDMMIEETNAKAAVAARPIGPIMK